VGEKKKEERGILKGKGEKEKERNEVRARAKGFIDDPTARRQQD
jgi:hypothetical protein